MARLEEIEAESQERVRASGEEAGLKQTGVVLMLFEADGVPEHDTGHDSEAAGRHLGRRSSRRPRPLRAAAAAESGD
jgi:hypothetical protein